MKQDRNGVRTAQDLERRYDFSSLLGLKRAVIQNETGLTKIENELNNFTIATLSQVENLQDQIDGNITTYYYSGVPTLTNLPTSEWKESQYNIHLGDLYYDKDTGYAYRFYLDSETNIYGWIRIKDSDVVEALSIANSANDTADSKRRVFVVQPQPPYDNGDLWLKDQELYVCQISKQTGNYEDGDFIIATKYTDDTYAKQVDNTLTVFSGKVTKEISSTNAKLDIVETATTTNGENISTLQTRSTEIEANLEGVTSKVTTLEGETSQLKQQSDSISAEVSNKADKTYIDTKLKQSDSISGELPLHYENSAGKDLIEFEIEGNSKQETTQGYNLFNGDFRTGNSANLNDKTRLFSTQVLYLKAGTYKATTNLDTTKYQFQHYTFSTTANPTAPVANILFTLGGWSTNKQCIINITEELEGYYYMLIKKIDNSELTPEDMKEYQFMLKAGIDEKPYEPYTNGASPNPDYPQEIEVVDGVTNLFDKDTDIYLKGYIYPGNYAIVSEPSTITTYIECKPDTKYTISLKNFSNYLRVGSTNTLPTIGNSVVSKVVASSNYNEITYQTTSDAKYLLLNVNPNSTNIQIEKGSIAHSYVPYGNYLPVKNVGENLFNKNDLQELYAYTDSNTQKIEYNDVNRTFYIKCDANSNYIVSKIRSAQFNVAWTKNKPKIGEPIYNLKLANYIQVHNGRDYLKINTGEDAKYLVVRYFQGAQDTTITKQEILDSIMIEKVDESTELPSEYKPYEEKISYINLNKSNLFDGVLVLGTLDLDGQFVNVNYRLCSENFIYVKSSSTYFIKNNKYDGLIVICYYDENKNLISRNTFTQSDKKVQFTTSSTTKYIKFCNDGVSTTPKNDLSTIYEIYEGYEPNYFIGKVGDIKDRLYLQNGHAYLEKKIGKVVLDGSENITRNATNISGEYRFFFPISDSHIGFDAPIISTHYQSTKLTTYSNYGIGYSVDGTGIFIREKKQCTMTLTEFKSFLQEQYSSGNSVEIYYILAILEIIDLGEVSISTLKGTNNLFIESNLEPSNCSIKYYLDTELNEIYTTHEEAHAMIKVSENSILQNVEEVKTDMNSQESRITNMEQTAGGLNIAITNQKTQFDSLKDKVSANETSANNSINDLNGKLVQLEGKMENMEFDFSTRGLSIASKNDPNSSLINNSGFKVYAYSKLMLITNNKGCGMDKLIVTGTAQLGYLKLVKSTKNGKPVTKIYHLKKLIESLGDLE